MHHLHCRQHVTCSSSTAAAGIHIFHLQLDLDSFSVYLRIGEVMVDWQKIVQSLLFGVVISFLLRKLILLIFGFRDEKARAHSNSPGPEQRSLHSTSISLNENEQLSGDGKSGKERVVVSDHSDSESDWEGEESTDLDEAFDAATTFVAATAADRAALKVSNDVQLQLYGLYKIATEGPCSSPQPSALKMTARAKWQAWQKLGAMPPEEAMKKYIDIVTELYPTWAAGSATKNDDRRYEASKESSNGPMGPVFSTFIYEEESESQTQLKMDAIHTSAREGDEEMLASCIKSGVPVDLKDSEGRTPLHWAVDRGHMNITELLLNKNADVNAKDDEGQTALHYAAVCERSAIAELLVKHGADVEITDNEGDAPRDLSDLSWPGFKLLSKAAA